MKYRVVVTAEADSDLLSIGLFVAEDSPVLAVKLVDRLTAASLELGDRALR